MHSATTTRSGARATLPPARVLAAAILLATLSIALAVTLAVVRPATGITLAAADTGVRVVAVHTASARAVLAPGDVIVALRGAGDGWLPLEAIDLTPEPDMAFMRYQDMDAFFARQTERATAMQAGHLDLRLADGRETRLPLAESRPITSLPFVFWFQLLCAVGGLLAGASVWAFRRQDPATGYYALTGVGMLMFASAAAVYSTRELAIDGALFKALSATNEFGALLFCGGLIAVLWYYPTRLARFNAGPWIMALYVALGLAIPLRLHDSVELLAHLPITIGYFSTYALAAVQWWRTRGDAFQRAALRAFLLAWLFGSGAFVAVMYLPAAFGIDNGAIQGYAFGFFLLIYAGIAAGVMRYQLFRLDRWWFAAWRVLFGGLAVIGLDLLLVYVLRLDARTSLLASLAIAGWLYFPLRQWLWRLLTRRRQENETPLLVRRVTEALSDAHTAPAQAWTRLLHEVFAPLQLEPDAAVSMDRVVDSGLAIEIAGNGEMPALRLAFARHGARLFNPGDLATLAELRRLFAEVLRYRDLLEAGVNEERDRVARDLHDDVGARLLSMSHQLPEAQADQARRALTELREVVYSMRMAPVPVDALAADWRAEVGERCEAADVQLHWHRRGEGPPQPLSGGMALALSRVLREVISNALAHARPPLLHVELTLDDDRLHAEVRHPHQGEPPAAWRPALGLRNLRERIDRLRGEIDWQLRDGELCTHWQVSLREPPPTRRGGGDTSPGEPE